MHLSSIARCGSLALLALVLLAACSGDDDGNSPDGSRAEQIREFLPTSLHGTARGMAHWYQAAQGGFETLTNIPYEQLSCGNCHVDAQTCQPCHGSSEPATGDVITETCLNCHGRQQAEIAASVPDVHRSAGFQCMDCHTSREIHGDGQAYDSFLDSPPGATCAGCHGTAISTGPHHAVHGDKLSCEACHVGQAVTCYNCHFQTEVDEGRKLAYGRFRNWVFLGNWNGQVYPMNFQSVEYQNSTFVAYGPFYGHTITRQGRACAACHDNAAIREYEQTGQIDVVSWDAGTQRLVPRTGVIPVPPNYQAAFQFDFATTQDGRLWTFLKSGVDASHMLRGSPLTAQQMQRLASPHAE
jgi:hypothetical protein